MYSHHVHQELQLVTSLSRQIRFIHRPSKVYRLKSSENISRGRILNVVNHKKGRKASNMVS
jgi:hypothetical protein